MRHTWLLPFLLGSLPALQLKAQNLTQPPSPPMPALLDERGQSLTPIGRLYNEAILREGSIDGLVRQLKSYSSDTSRGESFRAQAHAVAAQLLWRAGRLAEALPLVQTALELDPDSTEVMFLQAKLLEASGDEKAAVSIYTQLLAKGKTPSVHDEVQLRLVLMQTSPRNVGALLELARTKDQGFRNRVAIMLGILGHPGEALSLYSEHGTEIQRRHQKLRKAEWALQAGLAATAQEESWAVLSSSASSKDAHYALALLREAHEKDASWDKLLGRLGELRIQGIDTVLLRAQVLQGLGRLDQAIGELSALKASDLDQERQGLLLRLCREAGKTDELTTRLSLLMQSQPGVLAWPRSLSEHHLEQGDRQQALAVWRAHLAQANTPSEKLQAARAMIAQGLDSQAEECLRALLSQTADMAPDANSLLFELCLKRGRTSDALALLEALDQSLSANAPERGTLAENFERLHLPAKAIAVWEKLARRPGGLTTDETMRLAWLYDQAGRREECYNCWKSMWTDALPDSRRRMVEDRLLALGAELGKLGELAIDIEERLANGKATPRERSLLIRLYKATDDPASAIEVITEYFGRGQPGKEAHLANLKEQAAIYRDLHRTAAFERVTLELLREDPENAVEYTQSLIINQLELGKQPDMQKLRARLNDLQKLAPEAFESFSAGVMQMAGDREASLALFQKAFASNPGQSDYSLLIADLLAATGRTKEAIAMLQCLAEESQADDAFVVTIDGLLNRRLPPQSPFLRWAQRRVLERLANTEDKYFLYELSAEISEEMKDNSTYLRSLESALADAGTRRSGVLRELINATADKPVSLQALNSADNERNINYSRRLLALGEQLPPAIYLDLGKSLLDKKRPEEAMQVFMAALEDNEAGGLHEEAADRFAKAGFRSQAAVLYQKAIAAESAKPGLGLKLARLRYEMADHNQAFELTMDALLRLLDQQLTRIESLPSTEVSSENPLSSIPASAYSFEYRDQVDDLRNELLLTLDEAGSARVLKELEDRIDQAIGEFKALPAAGAPTKLILLPRLHALASQHRLIALQCSEYRAADTVDERLLGLFATDIDLATEVIASRLDFGKAGSATRLLKVPGLGHSLQEDLDHELGQASWASALSTWLESPNTQKTPDKGARLAAAFEQGDLAVKAYLRLIRPSGASGKEPPRLSGSRDSRHLVRQSFRPARVDALLSASHALTPESFASLCNQVFASSGPQQDEFVGELLCSGSPGLLGHIEKALGRALVSPAQLEASVLALPSRRLAGLDMAYVSQNCPGLDWSRLMLTLMEGQGSRAIIANQILARVLSGPVSATNSDELVTAFERRYRSRSGDDLDETVRMDNLVFRQSFDTVRPENQPLARRIREVIARWTKTDLILQPGDTLAAQDSTSSSLTLAKFMASIPAEPDSLNTALSPLYRQMPSAASRRDIPAMISACLADASKSGPSRTHLIALAALSGMDQKTSLARHSEQLASLAPLLGEDALALECYAMLCEKVGLQQVAIKSWTRLANGPTENVEARRHLAQLWLAQGHYVKAQEALSNLGDQKAATHPGKQPRDRMRKSSLPTPSISEQPTAQFRQIMQALVLGFPRQPGDQDSADMTKLLRSVRTSLATFDVPAKQGTGPEPDPLKTLFETPRPLWKSASTELPSLLRPYSGESFVGDDSGRLIKVMHPRLVDTEELSAFYTVRADALSRAGTLQAHQASLGNRLALGDAGAKELMLWLELSSRLPEAELAQAFSIAPAYIAAAGRLPEHAGYLFAHLQAKAGAQRAAANTYCLLLARLADTRNFLPTLRDENTPRSNNLAGLLDDAAKCLDTESLQMLVGFAQRYLFNSPDSNRDYSSQHENHRLWLYEFASAHGLPDSLVPAPTFDELDSIDALARVVAIEAISGKTEAALKGLRLTLSEDPGAGKTETFSLRSAETGESLLGLPLRIMFPLGTNHPQVASAWYEAASNAIPEWIRTGAVARDKGILALAVVGLRQAQTKDPKSARTFASLEQLCGKEELLMPGTANVLALGIGMAPKGSAPILSLSVLAHLELKTAALAPLLEHIAHDQGPRIALEAGWPHIEQTLDESLLAALDRYAQELHDQERIAQLEQLRRQAVQARKALDAVSLPTPQEAF